MLSVSVRDLRVEFPIYDVYMRSLRHQLGLRRLASSIGRGRAAVGGDIDAGRAGKMVIKALNGVSFELHDGDRLGLLGRNGSGKSTLLRTIAGIYEPTSGEIDVRGRVTPLFDLQLGMDPDATGLENISLRGRMLNLSPRQIEDSLDDIASFTQLGDYLYMPIRTYSAGMKVRLAFGVSTAITPEILILDEMIAAGDAAFIESVQSRLKGFIERTGILVVASHSMTMLRHWCNKGMLLDHGTLVMHGPLDEAIARYQELIARPEGPQPEPAQTGG